MPSYDAKCFLLPCKMMYVDFISTSKQSNLGSGKVKKLIAKILSKCGKCYIEQQIMQSKSNDKRLKEKTSGKSSKHDYN